MAHEKKLNKLQIPKLLLHVELVAVTFVLK